MRILAPNQVRTWGRLLIERWVVRHLGTAAHERRVLRIGRTLFDLTQSLHGLGGRYRRLLSAAALVHDVGRCINNRNHPYEGARLVQEDESLPLRSSWRRWLAYLTLYHRDEVPPLGEDDVLKSKDDHRAMRTVLALLRAADALDSRSLESPRLKFVLRRNHLRIYCYLRTANAKAVRIYTRERKFRLLEQALGCKVSVRVRSADRLAMVA